LRAATRWPASAFRNYMVEVQAPNVRTDAYRGKVENRAHLMLEVTATVV